MCVWLTIPVQLSVWKGQGRIRASADQGAVPDAIPLHSGVARICCEEGQNWKLCHGAFTATFRAGCSSCLMTDSFVTNAVLIERAVSC